MGNEISDDSDRLVEMATASLLTLAVDTDYLDMMRQNSNWVSKLHVPSLSTLSKRGPMKAPVGGSASRGSNWKKRLEGNTQRCI